MKIDHVRNEVGLDAVLPFVHDILPQLNNDEYRYSRAFWLEHMEKTPQLLLYGADETGICGSVFAFAENNAVTVGHCAVAQPKRDQGLGRALMVEMERRVGKLGLNNITLGAVQGAEGFYQKLGYSGSLLVQSQKQSIEQLKALNTTCEVIGTNVYEGTVNQVWLRVPLAASQVQEAYNEAFPECDTQITFGKTL